MAKRRITFGKIAKFLAVILLLLLLVCAFLAIYKFSNGFTTDIKTFYLVIDGEMVSENTSIVSLLDKTIEVHTIGDKLFGNKGFSYKIVRNTSVTSFVFYLNGERRTFVNGDYTEAFEIETTENSITVKSTTLYDVLLKQYGEGILEFPTLDYSTCYFTLEITSLRNGNSITLDFNVESFEGIILDHTNLVF